MQDVVVPKCHVSESRFGKEVQQRALSSLLWSIHAILHVPTINCNDLEVAAHRSSLQLFHAKLLKELQVQDVDRKEVYGHFMVQEQV